MSDTSGDVGWSRIRLHDGWPEPLPGLAVRASESSIVLGLSMTPRVIDSWLSSGGVSVSRVGPDLTEPASRRVVPDDALTDPDAFREWVFQFVGPTGRMAVWPDDESWWIVEDADWEVTIACGPPALLDLIGDEDSEDEFLSWLGPADRLSQVARGEAAQIAAMYGFTDT